MDQQYKQNLIEDLKKLPEFIAQAELNIMKLEPEVKQIKEQMIIIENEIYSLICGEIDVNNKQFFPTEKAKDNETQRRLQTNNQAATLKVQLFDVETRLKKEIIELHRLQNQFAADRAISRLLTPSDL